MKNPVRCLLALAAVLLLLPGRAEAQAPMEWQTVWIDGALSNAGDGFYAASHVVQGIAGHTFEFKIRLAKPNAGWYIQVADAANEAVVAEDYTGAETIHAFRGVFPRTGDFTIALIAPEPGSYTSTFNVSVSSAAPPQQRFQYSDPVGDAAWAGAPDITNVDLVFGDKTVTVEVGFAGTTLDRTKLCVAFDTDRTDAGAQWGEQWPKGAERVISWGLPRTPCIAGASTMSSGNDGRTDLDALRFTAPIDFTSDARFFVWAFGIAQDGTVRVADSAPGAVTASRWMSLGPRSATAASQSSTSATALNSFCFTFGGDSQGRRDWVRESPALWVEVYPDGRRTNYAVVGHSGPGGEGGEVVAALPARTFEAFVPTSGPTGALWIREVGQAWRRSAAILSC